MPWHPGCDSTPAQTGLSIVANAVTLSSPSRGFGGIYALETVFLKQVATAVGDGAIAGFAAEKYIAESEVFHEQIMKSDLPGIVYLYNAVDPKCREYLPIIEKMEAEYKGKARVTKVDIYKSTGIANRLGVKDVPSIVTIKDGKIDKVITGNICEEEIAATIQ